MAQMLQEKFSSDRHLLFANRHVRLSQRETGAAFLVKDIQPPILTLENAVAATVAKQKERFYTYDAVVFCDGILDNEEQKVYDTCARIDRESGSAPILSKIFPTGRVSDIKEAPLMQEPLVVKRLIERIQALGPQHPLTSSITGLQAKVTECDKIIATFDKLSEELAICKVQEDIAQRKLRDQYRLNYLHAQENLGKLTAELLFPVISAGPKPVETNTPESQPVEA